MDASGIFMSEIEKLARLTVQSPERKEKWEAATKQKKAEESQTGESHLRVNPAGRQERLKAALEERGDKERYSPGAKKPSDWGKGVVESAPSAPAASGGGPGWWGRRSRLQKGLMVGAPATAAAATGAAALIRHLSKRKKAE